MKEKQVLNKVYIKELLFNIFIIYLPIGLIISFLTGEIISSLVIILWIIIYILSINNLFEDLVKLRITRKKILLYSICSSIILVVISTLAIPLTFNAQGRSMGYSIKGIFEIGTNILFLVSVTNLLGSIYKTQGYKQTIICLILVFCYVYFFNRGLYNLSEANSGSSHDLKNNIPSFNVVINFGFYFKSVIRILFTLLNTFLIWKIDFKKDV